MPRASSPPHGGQWAARGRTALPTTDNKYMKDPENHPGNIKLALKVDLITTKAPKDKR